MGEMSKRAISLTSAHAAFIDAKVASGDYSSVSEVMGEGLSALKARDESIEKWLRGPVVETYDRMRADPTRGIPVKKAFELIRQRIGK